MNGPKFLRDGGDDVVRSSATNDVGSASVVVDQKRRDGTVSED